MLILAPQHRTALYGSYRYGQFHSYVASEANLDSIMGRTAGLGANMSGESIAPEIRFRLKSWPMVVVALLATQAVLSLTLKQGGRLVAYCETSYLLLLLLASGAAALNAVLNRRTIRLFWSFLAGAFGLWAVVPCTWLYDALLLGKIPPFLFDTPPLFLHIVLMIAAVVSRPHLRLLAHRPYRTTLNLLMLLFFLIFAYAYFLFPYSYTARASIMILHFEFFYFAENLLLLVVLAMLIRRSQPPWKSIYRHLFGASALYALGSMAANVVWALKDPTGDLLGTAFPSTRGLMGMAFTAAISWFVWIGLQGRKHALELARSVQVDTSDTRTTSVLAMVAVVAIPLVGLLELFRTDEPAAARVIRMLIVLIAVLLLAAAGFIRDYLSNRELASDVGLANDRLRLAMESGKSVGWQWDIKSGQESWFGDLQTMFGIPSAAHVGPLEDFRRYIHPDDREQVWKAQNDSMQSHKPYATEFRIVWPDGRVRYVMATGQFYYSPNGDPDRMVSMAVDITDRKQIEAELHESQDRIVSIVTSAMDAIIAIDEAQRIVLFNPSAEKMFGCPAQDAIGNHVERFIPRRFRAGHSAHIRQFGETGSTSRNMGTLGTLWALRANGDEFPIEASISHIDAAGKNLFTVILRDVTDRQRAEEALRESEERFHLVADTAPVLIWMSGTDKLCTFFNKGWLDFTGRSMEQELGEGWASGVHPEDLEGCLRIYSGAFDARTEFEMEYRLRRFDGKYRWIVDYGVPRFESNGAFCGYIGSAIDITDRKLTEESLEDLTGRLITAQEEERMRIARELHDDFSQRLALVSIGLGQLWSKLPATKEEERAKAQELLEETQEISSDMHALSHQLHPSRLEYVGLVPALRGLCEETSSKYGIQIEFTEREVSSKIPKDVALCLFRIAQEALGNVVKHSQAKQAQAELCGTKNEIRLRIVDDGLGFDPALRSPAAGIGLVSMRERLRLVGGTLSVRSAPMRGTEILAQVRLSARANVGDVRAQAAGGMES